MSFHIRQYLDTIFHFGYVFVVILWVKQQQFYRDILFWPCIHPWVLQFAPFKPTELFTTSKRHSV